MKLKLYQIDAFTDKVFSGNSAAICPLESWLSNETMQKIAFENNLAETAFYVRDGNSYQIRWFTPAVEVDLCGHATLATAYVLFNFENHCQEEITFLSNRSGELKVRKDGDFLAMNFPTDTIKKVELFPELTAGFNYMPIEAYRGKTDYMCVFESESQIRSLVPDFHLISQLNSRGVIVTAKGDSADFVSRFFAPQIGIDEDPVTGSAHTTLIPYWSGKLGKKDLEAMQLSSRGGRLKCKDHSDRVEISGQAKEYLIGNIFID